MRIGILGNGKGWHADALATACNRFGHEPVLLDLRLLRAEFIGERRQLLIGVVDLLSLDRAIVRGIPGGSLEQVIVRVDALHVLESSGIVVVNPPRAIESCVDKHLAAARLSASGLPTPPTVVCQSANQAMGVFDQLGGDVVVKPIFGAEGRGVMRIQSKALAERVFPSLEAISAVLLVQQFVPNAGYDARIFLVGDDMVASMRRWPANGDFRANVTLGGRAESFQPPDDWIELARRAARSLGARVAGVDLLPTDSGIVVLEVNSSPGFRALSEVTGRDVAARVVEFCAHSDQ